MLAGMALGLVMSSAASYAAFAVLAVLLAEVHGLPDLPPWTAVLVAAGSLVAAGWHAERALRHQPGTARSRPAASGSRDPAGP
jgi:hypothetical protein